MAKQILLNTVTVGTRGKFYAGTQVDDVASDLTPLTSAGAKFVALGASSVVDAASARCLALRKEGWSDADGLDAIMSAAMDATEVGTATGSTVNFAFVASALAAASAPVDVHGQRIVNAGSPVDPGDLATRSFVGTRYTGDKMRASAATTAANQTTGLSITATPARGYVMAFLNGAEMEVGDGVKTKDFYFSADGGATARATSSIVAGDALYWTKARELYDLAASDRISLDYNVLG